MVLLFGSNDATTVVEEEHRMAAPVVADALALFATNEKGDDGDDGGPSCYGQVVGDQK